MRKLLNTLYVTTPESYLSKDGMNVVISLNQQEVFRIPIINIEAIVTFGYMGAKTVGSSVGCKGRLKAMYCCVRRSIGWRMTRRGRCIWHG